MESEFTPIPWALSFEQQAVLSPVPLPCGTSPAAAFIHPTPCPSMVSSVPLSNLVYSA